MITGLSNTETIEIAEAGGLRVRLVSVGATIQSLKVPVGNGAVNVVLGYQDPASYQSDAYFMGVTLGRFANRIRNARFSLDGVSHQLDANETLTGHCLHGGSEGLHQKSWSATPTTSRNSARFRLESSDGEGGFPGNLEISVDYQIVNKLSLAVDYTAICDADTILSLSNHAYFNLNGRRSTIDTHSVQVFADRYTPMDATGIPNGQLIAVSGSDIDLRQGVMLARKSGPRRFDHNFEVAGEPGTLRDAASLYSPNTGIQLRIQTTQDGLQLYTGDGLGPPFRPREGVCFEPQAFPNSPNEAGFPTARLSAGATYRQRNLYCFGLLNPGRG